jgi:hypothetical protein
MARIVQEPGWRIGARAHLQVAASSLEPPRRVWTQLKLPIGALP